MGGRHGPRVVSRLGVFDFALFGLIFIAFLICRASAGMTAHGVEWQVRLADLQAYVDSCINRLHGRQQGRR